jgi:predicted acylesterase/phospholipase RssA
MVNTLLLGGGGMRCFSYVGAIHYLYKSNQLALIRNFVGVSGGAVIASLICMGYKPNEAYCLLREKGLLEGIFESGVKNDWFERALGTLLNVRGYAINATFMDLYRSNGKFLGIVATNLYGGKPLYFSHIHTPHVSIIDAVRASSAIPLVFPPVWLNKTLFLDGAISDPNPVEWIKNTLKCERDDIFAMYVKDSGEKVETEYWSRLLKICMQRLLNVMDEPGIVFSFDNVAAVDDLSVEVVDSIVQYGYSVMENHTRKHTRRKSI